VILRWLFDWIILLFLEQTILLDILDVVNLDSVFYGILIGKNYLLFF